jgi:hypothetical protein
MVSNLNIRTKNLNFRVKDADASLLSSLNAFYMACLQGADPLAVGKLILIKGVLIIA